MGKVIEGDQERDLGKILVADWAQKVVTVIYFHSLSQQISSQSFDTDKKNYFLQRNSSW